jgi:hypothetical protein
MPKVRATKININLSEEMNKACIHKKELLSTPNNRVTKQSILEGYIKAGLQRDGYAV